MAWLSISTQTSGPVCDSTSAKVTLVLPPAEAGRPAQAAQGAPGQVERGAGAVLRLRHPHRCAGAVRFLLRNRLRSVARRHHAACVRPRGLTAGTRVWQSTQLASMFKTADTIRYIGRRDVVISGFALQAHHRERTWRRRPVFCERSWRQMAAAPLMMAGCLRATIRTAGRGGPSVATTCSSPWRCVPACRHKPCCMCCCAHLACMIDARQHQSGDARSTQQMVAQSG